MNKKLNPIFAKGFVEIQALNDAEGFHRRWLVVPVQNAVHEKELLLKEGFRIEVMRPLCLAR